MRYLHVRLDVGVEVRSVLANAPTEKNSANYSDGAPSDDYKRYGSHILPPI